MGWSKAGLLLLALLALGASPACERSSAPAPSAEPERPAPSAASEQSSLRVAVASSFLGVARSLVEPFVRAHGARLELVPGASGKLHAQIREGAPLDVFLSADAERPEALEQAGAAVAGTRHTYAIGRLALVCSSGWPAGQPCPTRFDETLPRLLRDAGRLAVAEPRTAPFGRAALEVLDRLSSDARERPTLVVGGSIGQAAQFVASGDAAAGFLAAGLAGPSSERVRLVPSELHSPIVQQVVVLRDGPLARGFLRLLLGPPGRDAVARAGFELPPAPAATLEPR
jgi:molybdate transport system substrate-binding protein